MNHGPKSVSNPALSSRHGLQVHRGSDPGLLTKPRGQRDSRLAPPAYEDPAEAERDPAED